MAAEPSVGAIDQGTTGTRFMAFDHAGTVVTNAYERHEQYYPSRVGRARFDGDLGGDTDPRPGGAGRGGDRPRGPGGHRRDPGTRASFEPDPDAGDDYGRWQQAVERAGD